MSSSTNTTQGMLSLWKNSGVAVDKSYSCKVILAKIGSLLNNGDNKIQFIKLLLTLLSGDQSCMQHS